LYEFLIPQTDGNSFPYIGEENLVSPDRARIGHHILQKQFQEFRFRKKISTFVSRLNKTKGLLVLPVGSTLEIESFQKISSMMTLLIPKYSVIR